MTTLEWEKQPLTREVARGLRAATRKMVAHGGHRFNYSDLKELWSARGEHFVCTHDTDPVWQYYHRSPEGTVQLICCVQTRQEAQTTAEIKHDPTPPIPSGTYVLAWRPGGRTIRVACRSGDPSIQEGIFQRLGYETTVEKVA
jgi:hypothetical protein